MPVALIDAVLPWIFSLHPQRTGIFPDRCCTQASDGIWTCSTADVLLRGWLHDPEHVFSNPSLLL